MTAVWANWLSYENISQYESRTSEKFDLHSYKNTNTEITVKLTKINW